MYCSLTIWSVGAFSVDSRFDDVLTFWFDQQVDGMSSQAVRERWFNVTDEFDQACRKFEYLLVAAKQGELDSWLTTQRGTLAFVILCDQFPRNIYRGQSQAFTWDPLSLSAAKQGIIQQHDRHLSWDERSFFYLPFEHSENMLDQHLAVGLFTQLRDESPGRLRNQTGNTLRFAHQHRDIIQKFGRFPHRNTALGRSSTTAELDFIGKGNGFGQAAKT